ncbi:MAG TPA: rRNA maturation RNase YbeY [Thermoanaerobaculia bacterium]|nr:rRNA maturation RNase YbeY [Thermoanaerobaculia bacterium]
MTVDFRATVRAPGYPPARARRFLNRALALAGGRAREVSVVVCGDARMRALNLRFRRKDRTTDVLSFPAGDAGGFLGDLVISAPEARRQARASGVPLRSSMEKLLLHGLLHLLGYDHETDHGEMDALEAKLRRRLSIPA